MVGGAYHIFGEVRDIRRRPAKSSKYLFRNTEPPGITCRAAGSLETVCADFGLIPKTVETKRKMSGRNKFRSFSPDPALLQQIFCVDAHGYSQR
jgi:hypothetical protein